MHDTGALRAPRQRNLGVRATSQDRVGLSSHLGATSGTTVGVASRVGWVVDALQREGACTEAIEELSEHRRASNGTKLPPSLVRRGKMTVRAVQPVLLSMSEAVDPLM